MSHNRFSLELNAIVVILDPMSVLCQGKVLINVLCQGKVLINVLCQGKVLIKL